MSLTRVKALMKAADTGFLATTDGKHASVRPMSACAWFGKELWIATGKRSRKAADIRKCPQVEICFMQKDYTHVRIAGRCRISEAPADKKKMFAAFDWMANYFSSADDPSWVVVRIKPSCVRLMTMSTMEYGEVKV